jgi:hypothetical protein
MTHAAMHDALNAIERRSEPYALRIRQTPGASPEAAVATAAYLVLSDQFQRLTAFGFPAQQAALDTAYNGSLNQIPNGAAKTSGIMLGRLAAHAILSLRVADGWDTQTVLDFNYPQGTAPGEYKFTPPYNFAFLPRWGTVTPFILRDAAQFRPPPPYPLTSMRYTTKYHYNFWRPITAIREAATDGNHFTRADPTWTPLVDTPPIPDYDSAHSVEGGAAAQVLKGFFGTDSINVSTCSTTAPAGRTCNDPTPLKRSYTSFSAAAEENGLSRILVGFHFRKAVKEGIERGRKIGDRAVNRFLCPIH